MSFLKGILTDLRQRKLWPVPLVLIAAIVAVPVVLHKQAPAPAQLPLSHTPAPGTPVAAVTVDSSPSNTHPGGASRDPFTQQKQPTATTPTTASGASASPSSGGATATVSPAGASAGSAGRAAPTSSGGGSGSITATVSPAQPSGSAPASITPGAKPKPAPAGLSATQSYHVTVSMTEPSGGLRQIDPLQRLSILPNNDQPMLVELGVLQGGQRVLFAVKPGTKLSGPGVCTPGPIDCEILSLGQDQTEQISTPSAGATDFAVTAVSVDQHPSASDADQARRSESTAGRALLDQMPLSALSLFQYQPSVGAVVDLRNLTVGGN